MKIVISATGSSKECLLDRRFGRCEIFQIYDSEKEQYTAIQNKGATAGGGAGIAAAGQIIDEKVDVIITGNLGPNAYELLEKEGIKAYTCEAVMVSEAVDMFQKNQLAEINTAGNAHHGM
ncbi:NifB/NifX family molybdenum-iron cluster-binding protein [Anaerosacchariphilus polymeriproducens]|uniref:Diguanylate cyclase n=1 Tax=Anaerosacchariphilus polymeriproducens TaxID=1812858 RepID=A0A371AQF5_9FIRM|nr:NifB/NifX family molybdenum-iron cluster-binding protein [Anaerosacchariphilus polymeriproducens]RDU21805.1 diguanylate cyclase [Anaerosacchariphilus polymeriproducens]